MDLQHMSPEAEALQQQDSDRAEFLMARDDQRDNEELAALLELVGNSSDSEWDEVSAADAAGAAPPSGLPPTDGGENLTHFNISVLPTISHSPEVSNTGLSKYVNAELPSFQSTQTNITFPLRSGSYDGATSNSFFGRWDATKRSNTFQILDEGKEGAQNQKRGFRQLISLGGVDNIIVHPRGKSVGNNYYEYCLEWGGYDLKFWGNQESGAVLGDVRVRYGAEPVLEYGIDEAQRRLIDWLSVIGFTLKPEGERLTNVDFNVCVPFSVDEFDRLIRSNHCVSEVRREGVWKYCHKVQTHYLGSRASVLMRTYDKRAEMINGWDNMRKRFLTVERLIGDEWYNSNLPITRVEFSIGRERMKGWGINSLADFRARERAIVDYLTFAWFRLLAEPKVRGHEREAALHPLWLAVREAFHQCFDGATAPLTRVKKSVSCDNKRLGQQLMGLLNRLLGLRYGNAASASMPVYRQCCNAIIRDLAKPEHLEKLKNLVDTYESQKDCKLGENEGLPEFKLYDVG
jgi:hypothetical protein